MKEALVIRMRRRILFAVFCAGVAALGLVAGRKQSPGQVVPDVNDKTVMKFKLHYAQGVLEAITTENYPLLATNAQKLAQLSRQSSWKMRQTPEYDRLTADFRRTTEALSRAARTENADAATVAYFQMTVACVTCHKYLRGHEFAAAAPPGRAGQGRPGITEFAGADASPAGTPGHADPGSRTARVNRVRPD